jgi:hypothetical protein
MCYCLGVCPRGTPHSHLTGQRRCTGKEMRGSADVVSRRGPAELAALSCSVSWQPRLTNGNKECASKDTGRIYDGDHRRLAGFKTRTLGNRKTLSRPRKGREGGIVDVTKFHVDYYLLQC